MKAESLGVGRREQRRWADVSNGVVVEHGRGFCGVGAGKRDAQHVVSRGVLEIPSHLDVVPDRDRFSERADHVPFRTARDGAMQQPMEGRHALQRVAVAARKARKLGLDGRTEPGSDHVELLARALEPVSAGRLIPREQERAAGHATGRQ